MSLLVRYEILGLLGNGLTTNYGYCRNNTDILPLPFQIQLSEKLNSFFRFFIAFLESALNFEHFEKKKSFVAQVFPRLLTPKNALKSSEKYL